MTCDKETIKQKLAEAQKAYHDLMLGQQVRVFVDQNGERVEYTAANASRLQAYIQSLRSLINSPTGCPAVSLGPARFTF